MNLWRLLQPYRWLALALTLGVFAAFVAYGLWTPVTPGDAPAVPAETAPGGGNLPAVSTGPAGASVPAVPTATPAPAANPLDIFAVRNWEPPAPPVDPTANLPPPPPEAPPIPFRYAGKLEEAGKPPIFYLAQGDEMLTVRPGDLLKGDYRVGRIKHGRLHFLYRPLNIQQSIPVGGDT